MPLCMTLNCALTTIIMLVAYSKCGNVELMLLTDFVAFVLCFPPPVTPMMAFSSRLGKANIAFGRLSKRLWRNHSISASPLPPKWLSTVLCEEWTLHQRHVHKFTSSMQGLK